MFVEAVFSVGPFLSQQNGASVWEDRSNTTHFIFVSPTGIMSLRKRHAYPATFARSYGTKLVFGYGDSHPESAPHPDEVNLSLQVKAPEEYLVCEADCLAGTLSVDRDAYCTLPLYVGNSAKRLVLCNDYARTCALLGSDAPDIHPLGLLDALLPIAQQAAILRSDIKLLLERQRLHWHNGKLRINYPADASFAPVQLERSGDPRLLKQMLESTINQYHARYMSGAQAGFELSGGLDSTTVAGCFARSGPIITGTMLYPGKFGTSQQQKIQQFAYSFPLDESHIVPLDVERHYPLARMVEPAVWRQFYIYEDLYTEALTELAARFARSGVQTVFTGMGGDELCGNGMYRQPALRERITAQLSQLPPFFTSALRQYCLEVADNYTHVEPTPLSLVSSSVIEAGISRNSIYIEHRIWPVAPLANPYLHRYVQSLPIRYRVNKNILRAFQQAYAFPEMIYNPPVNEHFGTFFNEAMSKKLYGPLKDLLHDSYLVRRGFLDPEGLIESFAAARAGRHDDEDTLLFTIFKIMAVESNLQTAGIA